MDTDRLNGDGAGGSRAEESAGGVDGRPIVGVVGLGAMGRGIVQNLLQKGYSVVGHDINPQALAWLKDQGASVACDAEDLACRTRTVVSFVVDDRQTDEVLFGAFGLAQALRPGALLIACSTMSPRYLQGLEERLSWSGVELLDAPVTGGMVGARQGTLTVMVGGACRAAGASPAGALDLRGAHRAPRRSTGRWGPDEGDQSASVRGAYRCCRRSARPCQKARPQARNHP